MKFEKGDIVYWMGHDKAFGIVIGDCEYYKGCYRLYVNGSYDTHSSCSYINLRHATHDEKELLITALAKENKYYCEKTKTIKEMKKEFTKKDLKSGMWVQFRHGGTKLCLGICTTPSGDEDIVFANDLGFDVGKPLNDYLICEYNIDFSIDKVYYHGYVDGSVLNGVENMPLIWERETEENKQMKEMQIKLDEMKKAYNELEKNISETLDKLNGLKNEYRCFL